MRYFSFILALTLLISCKSNKNALETSTPVQEMTKPLTDYDLKLKEGACFGTCPVFEMTIDKFGLATYVGKNFSDRVGTYSKQLSEVQMKQIDDVYQVCNIYSLEDRYISNIPDMPMYTISASEGRKKVKTIMFKENRPDELANLHEVLRNIALNKEGWTLEEPANLDEDIPDEEKADPVTNVEELIIELEPTTKVSRWFKANKDVYGLYLIKKISPNSNYWLYTYDTTRFSPDEILTQLKADPGVKNVQFNVPVEDR